MWRGDIYTRLLADVLVTRRRWEAEEGESGGLMVSGGDTLRDACAIEEAECEDESFGDADFERYAAVALAAGRVFARKAAEPKAGTSAAPGSEPWRDPKY